MRILRIGRGSHNDVVINDPTVSGSHCQMEQDNYGNVFITDNNSTNGTYVNGTLCRERMQLKPSDVVRIGNSTLPWCDYFGIASATVVNFSGPDESPNYARTTPPPQGSPNYGTPGGYQNSPSRGYQAPYAGSYQTPPPGGKPNSYLTEAILCTIFCCLPFGIVSIVHASKVNGQWEAGNYAGAKESARKARNWFWWGFFLGLLGIIINVIRYFVLGGLMFV